ncbi:MAG TPA: acyltransferase [Caulobacteraceae bacterium]|nr:acyltransferase [Caulobacteraceae bacterium]
MTDITHPLEAPTAAPDASLELARSAANAAAGARNLTVGYLRAFITLLVLAHHAVIAYIPGLPKPPAVFGQPPFTWGAFPVEDAAHPFAPFGLLTGVNEAFFMSLMFLISGLFVWDSLKRKGAAGFVRDRVVRLGLPFAVAATILAPLAYYPAYRLTGAAPGVGAFARAWISLGSWPAGPAWFIWVLLAFGCLAAALYRLAPKWGETIGRLFAAGGERRALPTFAKLLLASGVAYTAFALLFGPAEWLAFGPFSVQAARILHYGVYFACGVGIGALGLERGLISASGVLARRWWAWALAAPLAFALSAVLGIAAFFAPGRAPIGLQAGADVAYALACATISFALLAAFARFVRRRSRVWDSLSANAYGMYLVHYVFVSWLQYALLPASMPGLAKGVLVFVGVVALSWTITAAMRRIPAVRRVV